MSPSHRVPFSPHGGQPRSRRPRSDGRRPVLAVGGVALAALAVVPNDQLAKLRQPSAAELARSASTCQTVLESDRRLSRQQLSQFLKMSAPTSRGAVHQAIQPPYCILGSDGSDAEREAYPMAFDPNTWLVVRYEQGTYQDYDFILKH